MPERILEELLKESKGEILEGILREVPEGMSNLERKHERILEGIPGAIPERILEDTNEGVSGGIPENACINP